MSLVKPLGPILILLVAFTGTFATIFQFGLFSPVQLIALRALSIALPFSLVAWGLMIMDASRRRRSNG